MSTATSTRELTGDTGTHIFIPLENELPVKEALHKALTAAGYDALPADPQQAHIADYLERVFGDIEGRADGWLITSIEADDYKVLTEHIAPALCGLVTIDPADNWEVANPYIAFEVADGDRTLWEDWDMTPDGVQVLT